MENIIVIVFTDKEQVEQANKIFSNLSSIETELATKFKFRQIAVNKWEYRYDTYNDGNGIDKDKDEFEDMVDRLVRRNEFKTEWYLND